MDEAGQILLILWANLRYRFIEWRTRPETLYVCLRHTNIRES
jgi:hypothetical protein